MKVPDFVVNSKVALCFSTRPILRGKLVLVLALALGSGCWQVAYAEVRSSANYGMELDTLASGGGVGASTSFQMHSVVSPTTAAGPSDSASFGLDAGLPLGPSIDADGDGVGDSTDNCPNDFNSDQANFDNDSNGDICDTDDDNDGTPDASDAFPFNSAETVDTDGDGIGNVEDDDDDGDSMPDIYELANNLDPLVDDAAADLDGDGTSNIEEYRAGTDPDDPNSKPFNPSQIVPLLIPLLLSD